ncbi:hypothetical protein ABT234_26660 [Streptomyces sp. NPDC001586]|uniref:hypothetical protein n=1 Tax=Streptomyces sp. NPDC001586 TaxID=3154387 RepID=UPI00331B22FA
MADPERVMGPRGGWRDLRVALVVAGEGLEARVVCSALALEPEASPDGSRFGSSGGRWVWNFGGSRAGSLDRQVLDLVSAVRPNAEGVRALVRAGHAVSVDIAGTAETGSGMSVPPALLEALATLDLPLGFTCLSGAGEPANDPMSWLDE